MPETVEVEYQANYVRNHFKGRELKTVDIQKGRYKTHGVPENFQKFKMALPLKLEDVIKKGKLMVFKFSKGWYIVSRLGLMGTWHLPDDGPKWVKTVHNIVFAFKGKELLYTDPISYGTLKITQDQDEVCAALDALAPDIVEIKLPSLLERLKDRPNLANKPVEEVITDKNALVSGIGNYLKSEILYKAGIAPRRKVSAMSREDWKTFLANARKVLTVRRSVIGGDVDKYMDTMNVFHKDKDPFGNKVVKYKNRAGLTIFWVPELQK